MPTINLFFNDYLAVESEAWTQFATTYEVEVKGEVKLGDDFKLRHLVEALSAVALTDELVWVMVFTDELAVSSAVELGQVANPQSVVELTDILRMWTEIPLQSSVVELTDDLVLALFDVYVEGVVELTDDLVLTAPERLPLKWGKTTPSVPTWTKVVVA